MNHNSRQNESRNPRNKLLNCSMHGKQTSINHTDKNSFIMDIFCRETKTKQKEKKRKETERIRNPLHNV